MAAEIEPSPASIRISMIAGRYLVFDPEAVARLRREQNTCGTLVGTVPQQPSQNLFLGLPIELRPEEVQSLVQRSAAHVVDNVAAHQTALRHRDRSAYVESIRRKKQALERAVTERYTQKAAEVADRRGASGKAKSRSNARQPTAPDSGATPDPGATFEQPAAEARPATEDRQAYVLGVTLTSSNELLPPVTDREFLVRPVHEGPLARFLQGSGYYMTPGLRFGSRYSVYPGDPLRFHAHYMANQYGWEQKIAILDIVEAGRLATAVKKAFLIGGQDPSRVFSEGEEASVRTFSIEWAGM